MIRGLSLRPVVLTSALSLLVAANAYAQEPVPSEPNETPPSDGTSSGPAAAPGPAPAASPDVGAAAPDASPAAPSSEAAPTASPAAPPADTVPATTPAATKSDDAANAADLRALLSQEFVNGASRATETVEQAPAATSVIRGDELRRYGIRTLGEALRFISMGTFTLGFAGYDTVGGRGVGLEGDGLNHFLLVVDGSRINHQAFGYGSQFELGLPISMIDRVEVILGPGSVVYGGNAMLGVINVHTRSARQMRGLRIMGEYGISPSQRVRGGIDSFESSGLGLSPRAEATYGTSFEAFGKEGEVTIGAVARKLELPKATVAPNIPRLSGARLEDLRGAYSRIKFDKLSADISYFEFDTDRLIPVPQVAPDIAELGLRMFRANGMYRFDIGSHISGFAAVRGARIQNTRQGIVRNCPPGGTPGSQCSQSSDRTANIQSLELQGTYDFLADGRYEVMLGAEGTLNQAGANPHATDNATGRRFASDGAFESSGQTIAGYAQFRGRLTKWLAVNAGVRGDRVSTSARTTVLPSTNPVRYVDVDDVINSAISPRAAAMFFPTDSTTVYASYSRAFRAPTAAELFQQGPAIDLAPKGISPETVDSGELGVKQRFGSHRAISSIFASKWDGLLGLSRGGAAGKLRYDSVGEIANLGVNLGVEGALASQRFHYGLTFT
ncbi:MAG TPA: TonB-dependent receptor, partial [Labilithrix sp.]|nr:TonB-dependent receptor [Labilithrix sp.]